MKRFALLVVVVAALAGAFYWVRTHYDGDASQAWASLRSSALALVSQAPKTDAAPRAAPADGQGKQAGRPGGGGGQNPRVPVMTAVAQSANLPITRASVGWVEPIATVTVRARIEGEMVERRVQDGQMVKEGDVLFRLDDREIQAQIARDEAGLVKDQATAAKTQNDVRRVQELLGKGAASQQQFDVVTADSKVAAANVAADQAALQADRIKLGYTTMRAPISGRVGVVRVTEGNLVRANDTGDGLVTITQMQPLRATFTLPERDLDLLRAALARKEATPVRAYAGQETEPLATGRLNFVDSAVDTLSGTVTAKALFDNKDGRLWPGQYVRIDIDLGMRPGVTTAPLVAVQPSQDGPFIFVVKPDNTVERRPVEVAEARGGMAALASGLKPGEKIVIEGQQRLKAGMTVMEKAPQAAADTNTNRTTQAASR
jgi:multidrug efflux system membrane fusion protein